MKTMLQKAAVVILVIAAFTVGYLLRGEGRQPVPHGNEHDTTEEAKVEVWTCSMHPQIRQPKPGQCPLCGMDLIPVTSGAVGADQGPRELSLSPSAMKLAEIQVAPVERKFVTAEIRMVGKIDYDETRLGNITAWVPGRIDRLYVDYTGVSVRKGDHMVYLYSPELLTAQQELIQAQRTVNELKRSGLASLKETALLTVTAARDKLRLWGLTQEQISDIEKRGETSDHMTIYAPMTGIVIHKNGVEGMYVQTGTKIYTIADLSQVWVKLDAYESDLAWLRYGQEVTFQTEAYPGEVFKGRIAFIDPVLDAKTRTVKLRVNVPNLDGRLKPEMFVRAVVRPRVAAGGKVVDTSLAGKWISPMHPEVIKDGPGRCDICGMPLVRAESLGFVTADDAKANAPLVIPATAPLITGKRAVVYVEEADKPGTYQGRVVVLGPRAGDYYQVKAGLREGELVVVNGNFKIDSAVQILAKPSMMNPEGGAQVPGHQHGAEQAGSAASATETESITSIQVPRAFKSQIDGIFTAYFGIQQALSQDKLQETRGGTEKFLAALTVVDMGLLKGPAHMAWMEQQQTLKKSAQDLAGVKDLKKARSAFIVLSDTMYTVAQKFGTGGKQTIFRFHCPMAAEGKGAFWLQNKPGTENPYFGAVMFKCGSQTETISPG